MLARLLATAALAASVSACGTVADISAPLSPFDRTPARVEIADPAPYVRGTLRPYVVRGRAYTPAIDESYDETGVASWYGDAFHGRPTASGEIFDMNALTAAHTTLPLPSLVEVTNLATGQSIVVRLNDRGPFVGDRIIDLSRAAADALGVRDQGLAQVRVRWLGPAPRDGGTSQPFLRADLPPRPAPEADFGDVDAYFIQAGTFAERENAEALRRRFGGGRTTIQDVEVGGRRMFRVLIGPWTGRREAERQRSTLAGQGLLDAFLVRAH